MSRKLILRQCIKCGNKKMIHSYTIKRTNYTGLCYSCNQKNRVGEKNSSWKGGRKMDGQGYMMVIAKGHPLATKQGYVAEHRLIASEKYGIFVVMDNIVHHIDGDKTNNDIENLELVSRARHASMHHRNSNSKNQGYGRPNPSIECACGCGKMRPKYDLQQKPRKYISGHQRIGRCFT